MFRIDARVRSLRTRAVVFRAAVLLITAAASPVPAAELRLPSGATAFVADLAARCPTCGAAGYTPCGSPDVGWGDRFAKHALLGTPKRGYLVTFAFSGDDFRALARTTPYPALLTTLQERFAATRLVVVEDEFARARVLPEPEHVDLTFPRPLHDCIADPTRPWGCCVGDCSHECCEKGLGSPTVVLAWNDGDERVTFHYAHTIGVSWLERRGPKRRVRYACLTDARGTLRTSGRR